ncbi:MAG: alpha/beta hydrolase [Flavobacteriales bacterium]|nr:alpha/beta hydrolase [Flavobacteriales bacterium]
MKNNLLFYCFLLFSIIAQSQDFKEEEIELTTRDDKSLYGTVVTNDQNDSTIVLVIPGSGPTDRDGNSLILQGKNNSLKYLAEDLIEANIPSLRIDKRGVGKSAQAMTKEEDLTFDMYVEDVVEWGNILLKDDRFNQIIIAGHSEGSLIGMIAAQKIPAKAYISIAGSGIPADSIITKQMEGQPEMLTTELERVFSKLRQGDTVGDVNILLYSLFRPSIQPYMISWIKYHPTNEIAKLDIPILIVQGNTDIQISVDDAKSLNSANKLSTLIIIDQMNHVFKEAPIDRAANIAAYTNPELKNVPLLASEIIKFISELK